MGTLLMGVFREQQETTQITFKSQGELSELQAIATADGQVKGKLNNPSADPPLRSDGKLNVGGAVGPGFLAVVRHHPLQQQPYTGMVPLTSGEVGEDLAVYLADSEQQNCALGLGVSIDRNSAVLAAGGFLVQVLPFASEATVSELEANIAALPSVSEMLAQGLTARQICSKVLGSLESTTDEGFQLLPKYGPCDAEELQTRMKRAVAALGEKEIADIIAQEGKLEVTCEFCKSTFVLDHEQILRGMQA